MKNIEKVRQQLKSYLSDADNEISQSAVSRGIGVSTAAISQFLAGKYTGDNVRLAQRIHAWIQKQSERQEFTGVFEKTLGTIAVKRTLQTARLCHVQREIGVVTGPAGAGKTRGVHLYARKNPDAILIEVLPYYSARYVMRDIHKAIGFSGHGTTIDLTNQVIDKLKNSGRILIIDEAEHLPYKALELVRRLHDLAGIGLLLVGMPQLISNLRGNRDQYRQLYSRVGIHTVIPDLNDDDVKMLVHSELPASNGLWQNFADETMNARNLSKLLKTARQIAGNMQTDIDAEIIHQAREYIIL